MAEVRKIVSADMVLAQQFTGHVAGWSAFAGKCGQALLPGCDAFAHFAQSQQSFFSKSTSIETSLGSVATEQSGPRSTRTVIIEAPSIVPTNTSSTQATPTSTQ